MKTGNLKMPPKVNVDSLKNLKQTRIHPALRASFLYCFHKASVRYSAFIVHAFSKYRIIPAQYGVLKFLNVAGPLSQITLGDEMGIDKATMVKLIDGLENERYIRRVGNKKDRRIKLIYMTPKGHQILQKSRQIINSAEERLLSSLSTTHKDVVKKAMPLLLESSIQMIQDIKK